MSTTKLSLFIFLFAFFFFPTQIHAQIIINEFLADPPNDQEEKVGEWVELFNQGLQDVNVEGFVLKDKTDSHRLIISTEHTLGSTVIQPNEFITIKRNHSSFSLNNTDDEIYLFDSTQSATPIDFFAYSSTLTNKTWGRLPDGTGDFFPNLDPTPGSPNTKPPDPPSPTPEVKNISNSEEQTPEQSSEPKNQTLALLSSSSQPETQAISTPTTISTKIPKSFDQSHAKLPILSAFSESSETADLEKLSEIQPVPDEPVPSDYSHLWFFGSSFFFLLSTGSSLIFEFM